MQIPLYPSGSPSPLAKFCVRIYLPLACHTAFDLNVKASNAVTRDAKALSFLPGIGNRKLHSMGEVGEAMKMGSFNDNQKDLIRGGPCGATWLMRVYKEDAGASSTISSLHSLSVGEELMLYTGYCINTGDGDGGGSGGVYHLCYGVASMKGAKAWVREAQCRD